MDYIILQTAGNLCVVTIQVEYLAQGYNDHNPTGNLGKSKHSRTILPYCHQHLPLPLISRQKFTFLILVIFSKYPSHPCQWHG